MYKVFFLIVCTLLLSACENNYSVTEQEISKVSNAELRRFQNERPLILKVRGNEINVVLETVSIDLKSEDGGKVVFKTQGKLTANLTFLGRTVSHSQSFSPVFIAGLTYVDGQFFLNNPRLDPSTKVTSGPMEQKIYAYMDQLATKIEQLPIYRLEHSIKEKIAAKLIKSIEITDTEIRFM